jgi:hypothetical protein
MDLATELRAERRINKIHRRDTLRALRLQAKEYERRLRELNNEHQRTLLVQLNSVSAEKFEAYVRSNEEVRNLALASRDDAIQRLIDRVNVLENWRSKATGVIAVVAFLATVLGAGLVKAFGL